MIKTLQNKLERFLHSKCFLLKFNLGSLFTKTDYITLTAGVNVIKLFTAVIYCHSSVIASFCAVILPLSIPWNERNLPSHCFITQKDSRTVEWQ
jgi:hypothetical protein